MDKQKVKLKQMIEDERIRVKGYEELARVYNAYISILLKRLKATEDNKVVINKEEIAQAIDKSEARALMDDECVALYYEETE